MKSPSTHVLLLYIHTPGTHTYMRYTEPRPSAFSLRLLLSFPSSHRRTASKSSLSTRVSQFCLFPLPLLSLSLSCSSFSFPATSLLFCSSLLSLRSGEWGEVQFECSLLVGKIEATPTRQAGSIPTLRVSFAPPRSIPASVLLSRSRGINASGERPDTIPENTYSWPSQLSDQFL